MLPVAAKGSSRTNDGTASDLNDLNNLDPNKIKEQVGDVDTDAVKDALGSQDLEEMQKQAMQVLNTVGKCKPSDDALKAHKASLVAITVHNAKLQGRTRIPEGTFATNGGEFRVALAKAAEVPFSLFYYASPDSAGGGQGLPQLQKGQVDFAKGDTEKTIVIKGPQTRIATSNLGRSRLLSSNFA